MKRFFNYRTGIFLGGACLGLTLAAIVGCAGSNGGGLPPGAQPGGQIASYATMGCQAGTVPMGGASVNPFNYSYGYGYNGVPYSPYGVQGYAGYNPAYAGYNPGYPVGYNPGYPAGYNPYGQIPYTPYAGGYYPLEGGLTSPYYPGTYGGYPSGINSNCVPTGQIFQACSSFGGQVVPLNGIQVCRLSGPVPVTIQGPLVATSSQQGFFPVLANDTLTFSADPSSSFCEKPSGTNCNEYTIDGHVTDPNDSRYGAQILNGTAIAGLVATDGTELFNLGSSTTKVITHNGMLAIGINDPKVYQVELHNPKLTVTRCLDNSGKSYQCQ